MAIPRLDHFSTPSDALPAEEAASWETAGQRPADFRLPGMPVCLSRRPPGKIPLPEVGSLCVLLPGGWLAGRRGFARACGILGSGGCLGRWKRCLGRPRKCRIIAGHLLPSMETAPNRSKSRLLFRQVKPFWTILPSLYLYFYRSICHYMHFIFFVKRKKYVFLTEILRKPLEFLQNFVDTSKDP